MYKTGFLALTGYVIFCFGIAAYGIYRIEQGDLFGIIPFVSGMSWGMLMPIMAVIRGWLDD